MLSTASHSWPETSRNRPGMSVGGIKKKISGMGGVRIVEQGGDAGRKGVGGRGVTPTLRTGLRPV